MPITIREKMKILFISRQPIANQNSVGQSCLNAFRGLSAWQYASVFCTYGKPDDILDLECFQITEKMLIENLKDHTKPAGCVVLPETVSVCRSQRDQSTYDFARKMRWNILFRIRNLIWKVGRWKSPQFKAFLDDFKPDLIFSLVPNGDCFGDIAMFAKQYTGAPMVGWVWDDTYNFYEFSLSPFVWIDRAIRRKKMLKNVNSLELLYVISEIQKREYESIFNPPCKILTKSANFNENAPDCPVPDGVLKLLYAGNLGSERWRSLALIADAVEKLNREGYALELNIYSPTPLKKHQKQKLVRRGVALRPPIPYKELQKKQQDVNILIHVEGLSRKSQLSVHQSFSTKLVDYFALGKCIFAIGTEYEASIFHLLQNDAAIVAQTPQEVYSKLKELTEHRERISEYGKKAYICGKKYHNKAEMETMLKNDLIRVVENYQIANTIPL